MTTWNTFGRNVRSAVLLLAIPALLFGCGGGGGGSSNAAASHTVTATTTTGGTISPASTTVDDGAIANLTVTPDSGYAISSVSGCGGTLSGNTYTTGAITADCTVSASFIVPAAVTHTVTATAGTGGAISPASATVNDGDTTSFTVTPNSGYAISSVSGCGGTLSGNTYTTGAITADCTVSASFIVPAAVTHTVTATASTGGAISPASATVNDGDTTSFTVTPDSGYAISSVGGCGGSLSGNTYTTGAITADCTVTASFIMATHTVTATAGTGGAISPANATVNDGDTTSFTVTPDSGYAIDSVSGCGGTLSGSTYTTGAITADCSVTANFITTHSVTATAYIGGAISPASATVNDGATTSFTVPPDSYHDIDSVSGCGGSLSGNTYTTGAITADCTVTAFFIATHNVTTIAGTGGTISPTSATVKHGDTTSFTVTPDNHYSIGSVTGCSGTLSGNTYTTGAITGICTVTASFVIDTYTVGGTVSGLSGSGLVLQNNGGDDLSVAGVSFTFATAVNHGSSYDVTVLTQPTGQSCTVGNGSGTLNGANVTDVSITCKGWGTAGLIENDDTGSAMAPQIAIDGNGNGLAVWQQSDGTRDNIWANRYTAGSGWGTAELIENDNTGGATSPTIAIDGNGNALAVWYQSDGTRDNIWANRYTAGSGWGTAGLIESDNAGAAWLPQIAIDGSGNALAVWQQSDGTRHNIWANRYTAGSGWGTAELIESDNAGDASSPQIAFDSNGNALAVWYQNDGTRYNIQANRYTAGSGWGTAGLIENDNTGHATAPQVAVDSNGNAMAVWQQSDGTRYNIQANRYTAGSGWGTAELIESDNTGDAMGPQIVIDSSDNALAVWQQAGAPYSNIWSNRYTAGSGWGTAELIENDDTGNAMAPQIAVGGSGNALAVWQHVNGTRFNIQANRYIAGSGWGSAALIESDDTGDARTPQVAVDSNDNALAVWYQNDGTRDNIQANRFE